MYLNLLFLLINSIIVVESVKITPPFTKLYVREGDEVRISCTGQGNLQWFRRTTQNALNTGSEEGLTIQGQYSNGDNVSILTYSHAKVNSVNDTFICKNNNSQESQIDVQVVTATTTSGEFVYQEKANLTCTLSTGDKIYWMKNTSKLADEKDSADKYKEYNNTLEFLKPTREYAGVYDCAVDYPSGTIKFPVPLYADPLVLPFDKSKNLVQEETLVILCTVRGYPVPNITWFKDGKVITAADPRIKLRKSKDVNKNPVDNDELVIDSVDFDDSGEYACTAEYNGKNSTKAILVRVKDKLAALWPFLGIVAEVVVLCTIIFIYEKRRNKDAVSDEDAAADSAPPEKKSENVRHRGNANNPTT